MGLPRGKVYRGIAFPFRRSTSTTPAASSDDQLIKEDLQKLILLSPNDRVMRDVGSGALAFVFENNNDLLTARIQDTVANAITRFEPRVIVQSIDVQRTASDAGDPQNIDSVIITVNYVVPATQRTGQASVRVGLGAIAA